MYRLGRACIIVLIFVGARPAVGQLIWSTVPYGHTALVESIAFSPDGLLAFGSFDSTVKLWNVSTVPGVDGQEAPPQDAVNLVHYPNPAYLATTIQYTLSAPADVQLSVYDMLGRRLSTLVHGSQAAGGHGSL